MKCRFQSARSRLATFGIAAALFAALWPASRAAAQTYYFWNGSDSANGNYNVSDPANWDDGGGNAVGVPTAPDSGIVIFSDYAGDNTYVNFDTALAPDAVYFDFSSGATGPFYYLTGSAGFDDSANATALSMNVTDPSGALVVVGTTNSYCGPTVVQFSYLQLDAAGALGASTGGASARYTSTLEVDAYGYVDLYGFSQTVGALAATDETGVIDNTNPGTISTLTVAFGANAKSGAGFSTTSAFSGLLLGDGVDTENEGTLALVVTVDPSAAAQNAADFTFSIGGDVPNAFAGGTTIVGPGQFRPLKVSLTGDEGLGLGPLTLGGQGCLLDLNGFDQTVTGLTDLGQAGPGGAGHGLITNGNANAVSTLTVFVADGDDPFSGTIAGPLVLTKEGAGSLTLSAANSYSGGTIVSEGTLQTTVDGALGSGPLMVNSDDSPTVVNLGGSETLSNLSDTVAANTATVNIAAGASLTVQPAATATFDGTLALAAGSSSTPGGSFTVAGTGAEVLTAAPQLGNNSILNVAGGTLRVEADMGTVAVGTGVVAQISGDGTLELAGSLSALGTPTPGQRARIENNSTAAAGLLVSGGTQQVGGIDGTGNVELAPPEGESVSLTADHITAGALVIGGDATSSATLTIAASDPSGNPTATSGFALADSLSPSAPLATSAVSLSRLSVADGASSARSAGLDAATRVAPSGVGGSMAVPEPSTLLIALLGLALLGCFRRRR